MITIGGEIDIASLPELAGQLVPLADTGQHLVLDVGGLRFCDCAGLSVLVRLRQRATARGGSLQLTELTPALRRLITLVRLDDILLPAAPCPDYMTGQPEGNAVFEGTELLM